MALQTDNLVLIEAGVPRTLDATNDTLSIGPATTFSKALTVSAGGLAITGDSSVSGNLTVTGDIVSRGTTNLLINDAIIDLATGNTGTVPTPGGFTVQMNRASGFTAGTVTTFVAGVPATSNPTFTYTDASSSTLLTANDIVAITGSVIASNDGLYAVSSVNQASFPQIVTIKGIGTVSTLASTPFVQNQVTASTANTATACRIDLAVLLFADGGAAFKDVAAQNYPKGTVISAYKTNAEDSDFTGNAAYTIPAAVQTLQDAYNGGQVITTSGSNAIAITLASGGFTVNGGGAVDLGASGADLSAFSVGTATMSVAATSTVDIQAASAITIDSSAGAIQIGNDANAFPIDIGTGAAQRTITLGNVTGNTAVVVNAGTGASSVNVTGAGTFALVAGTGNIDLATNATDHALTVGGVTGASAHTMQSGTGAMTLTAGGVFDVNAVGAVTIDSSTSTIGIGVDAVAQAINIGTGAAARAITVGNAASTSVNLNALAMTFTSVNALALTDGSATLQLGGTGATSLAGATTVDLDSSGAFSINSTAGAIKIGDDADANSIDIGTGAAARTITVGNVTGATAVNLNAGTGGMTFTTTGTGDFTVAGSDTVLIDAAGVLELNSSAAAIKIGNDAVTHPIDIGTGAAGRVITVGNVSGNTAVNLNAGTGGMTFTTTGVGDFTVVGSDTVLIDAAGILELNSSAGEISIGNDNVAQNINVGTQGGRTIAVGSAAATTVNLDGIALSLDSRDTTNLTMTANAASTKVLTIEAINSNGAGNAFANLLLKAKSIIQIGDNTIGSAVISAKNFAQIDSGAGFSNFNAGDNLVPGDFVYLKYDAVNTQTRAYKSASNDATAADIGRNVLGVCMNTANTGLIANIAGVPGTVINTTFSCATGDIGLPVYIASTAGALTKTAPTAAGNTVFKVGYIASNTGGLGGTGAKIVFQPQFVSKIP